MFDDLWVYLWVCLHNYAVGYASMLNWSLVHWGLTRSNGVSQDCDSARAALFLLSYSHGKETQSVGARVQDRGSSEDMAHRPSCAGVFNTPWPPQSAFFIISSLTEWLSLISPVCGQITQRALMMSVVTTLQDILTFLSQLPPQFMAWLILRAEWLQKSRFIVCNVSKHTYCISSDEQIFAFLSLFCYVCGFVRFNVSLFPFQLRLIEICFSKFSINLLHVLRNTRWKKIFENNHILADLKDALFSLTEHFTWYWRAGSGFQPPIAKPLMFHRALKQDRCICFKPFVM